MPKNSFTQWVDEYASISPNAVALTAKNQSYTYWQMSTLSKKAADYLKKNGIRFGDHLLCRAEQSVEFLVLYSATLRVGAIFVPIEKDAPQRTVEECIRSLSVRAFFGAEQDKREDMLFLPLKNLFSCVSHCEEAELPPVSEESDGLILFTSGSTGKRKAARITQKRSMQGEAFAKVLGYTNATVAYLFSPVNHMAFFALSSAVLASGGELILSQGLMDLKDFISALESRKANALHATPSVMRFWLGRCKELFKDFSSQLKILSLAGEKVSLEVQKEITTLLPNTKGFALYGSTEAGVVSFYEFGKEGEKDGCVGKLLDGVTLSFDKERVLVSSPYAMKSYMGEREIDGLVQTDDRGAVIDGDLYIYGRIGDVFLSGGHKIDPLEVESAAKECPFVTNCVCAPRRNGILGQEGKLFVEWKGKDRTEELKKYLFERLESYKVPRLFENVSRIQKTPSGKTDRKYYKEREE